MHPITSPPGGELRHVAFDTETTGFSSPRVIELAAIEFDPSTGAPGRRFHTYLDPQGTRVEAGAYAVHGLSERFLQGQPRFAEVADAFIAFVAGARLYAHNAPFDRRMLDAELGRMERPGLEGTVAGIVCTLALAHRRLAHLPRKKLDDLCDHYAVDRSGRARHGALIDCALLAQVAVRMGATIPPEPEPAARVGRAGAAPATGARAGWRPGGPWLDDERRALAAGWRRGEAVSALAAHHGRTIRAIVLQLQRMGEIDEARALALMAGEAGRGTADLPHRPDARPAPSSDTSSGTSACAPPRRTASS